ncbi:MAG TPA: lipoyl(octanoyl) transferase LipB [Saprospiraceae bacterium]|nr:lipoyl(octanoyl) transferase LipB [Saprospiraceae bacterium]
MKQKVIFKDLGIVSFEEVWKVQTGLHKRLIDLKLQHRSSEEKNRDHYLLFCEHNPVYTMGKSGDVEHLLISQNELKKNSIEFIKINRGGDITYHGPGQIIGYPIFDLDLFFTDVHRYVRTLEEAVIRTIAVFGIKGQRIEKYTGVWVSLDSNGQTYLKICAIGVHLSRWVTMHGFALNVNTDLSYFKNIIPCGIQEEGLEVTSMKNILKRNLDIEQVKEELKQQLASVFNFEYLN